MKKLILALLMVLTLFTATAKQPIDSTHASTSISIAFKANAHSSLVVVPLTLNGHVAYFLVDCGSEMTILEQSTADAFGFSIDDSEDAANIDWSGHSVAVNNAKYATIQIGDIKAGTDIKVANIRALLGAISGRVKANIVGIVGADTLKKYHLVIDYSNNTIHN
jgi:predicted aspartyl protease